MKKFLVEFYREGVFEQRVVLATRSDAVNHARYYGKGYSAVKLYEADYDFSTGVISNKKSIRKW